jgi:DDE superfamily endonuclease/Transposase
MAKTEDNITSAEIQGIMEKKGVSISSRTIRRRIHESGGKYINEIQKPPLTDNHREKRLQWAKKYQNFSWDSVIFSDESTFQIFPSKKKTWQFDRKRKICRTVKHSPKIHVWECFSASGFGRLVCFQQNLNANFMCKIYKRGLLPSSTEFFGADNLEWFLQEDNDPKHRSKIARNWKEENGISVLPWPSMSPDQNPIENVWHVLKSNLAKKKIRSVSHLKISIEREWNNLSPEFATKLVSSMNRRVEALIKAEGDYTMY